MLLRWILMAHELGHRDAWATHVQRRVASTRTIPTTCRDIAAITRHGDDRHPAVRVVLDQLKTAARRASSSDRAGAEAAQHAGTLEADRMSGTLDVDAEGDEVFGALDS